MIGDDHRDFLSWVFQPRSKFRFPGSRSVFLSLRVFFFLFRDFGPDRCFFRGVFSLPPCPLEGGVFRSSGMSVFPGKAIFRPWFRFFSGGDFLRSGCFVLFAVGFFSSGGGFPGVFSLSSGFCARGFVLEWAESSQKRPSGRFFPFWGVSVGVMGRKCARIEFSWLSVRPDGGFAPRSSLRMRVSVSTPMCVLTDVSSFGVNV